MEAIKTDQLELLFKNLFSHLRRLNINELSFDEDFYWNVRTPELTDLSKDPELTIGSLKDDIEFLKLLLKEDFETNFLELERLSALLKHMSKKLCH